MQKFGLDSIHNEKYSTLELGFIEEQATALGVAGKKLKISIEKYLMVIDGKISNQSEELLIKDIAENVYSLILQREFVGFVHGNMEWITKHYKIPKQALKILGISNHE